MPEFEDSDSQWSQALIRLDLAKSIVADPGGDAEEAAGLVRRALDLSAGNPITSVVQRSREFMRASARRWSGVQAVADLRDAVSSTQLS